MRIRRTLAAREGAVRPVILAAGFFDGIHRGHQRVLAEAVAAARRAGGEAWVLTFDVHPLEVLRPDSAPRLLMCNRHKLLWLERCGIDACLLLPFRRRTAGLEPEEFVARLHAALPTLRAILVGRHWRFGRGGRGNPRLLSRLGRERGFEVRVMRHSVQEGVAVSSTRVRSAVQAGDLPRAREMLGRPFSVLGTVKRGRSVGRTLGYPTANLALCNEALPPRGVYAVRALITRGRPGADLLDGVLNFGLRPTFAGTATEPVPELHLFDVNLDLYGCEIEVFFVERLRPERRFASAEDLRRQIAADVGKARRILLQTTEKELLYTLRKPVL